MTWFKVDDTLAWHEKVVRAGNAAMGLWVRAGSWSSQQLSEGFVPDAMIVAMGDRRQAAALVDVGLWLKVEGGFQFHDWPAYQPSKAEVLANRKANAARQTVARNPELREAIRVRDGDRCRYCGRDVRWSDRRSVWGGTYDHIDPAGGSTLDNLVVACRGCNARKGRRTPEEAGMRLLPIEPVSAVADLDRI